MNKRGRKMLLVNSAIFQILLLIGMSFSIAFIFSKYIGVVKAITESPGALELRGDVIVNPSGDAVKWIEKSPANGITSSGAAKLPTAAENNLYIDKLASKLDDPKLFPDGSAKPPVKPGTTTPAAPSGDPAASRGLGQIFKDIYGGGAFGGVEAGGFTGVANSFIGGAAWGFTNYEVEMMK